MGLEKSGVLAWTGLQLARKGVCVVHARAFFLFWKLFFFTKFLLRFFKPTYEKIVFSYFGVAAGSTVLNILPSY